MKKIISILMCYMLVILSNAHVYAKPENNSQNPIYPRDRESEGYTWVISSVTPAGTQTMGSWVLMYSGFPAQAAGEMDTVSFSDSYSHTFSGTFALSSLQSQAQIQLGYSFGYTKTFQISKSSRLLAKGEYVKAYSMKTYEKSTIYQKELYYNTMNDPIYRETGRTMTAYGLKAILPQIKLEYYMSQSFVSNPSQNMKNNTLPGIPNNELNSKLIKVEYYQPINGTYVKVNEQTFK